MIIFHKVYVQRCHTLRHYFSLSKEVVDFSQIKVSNNICIRCVRPFGKFQEKDKQRFSNENKHGFCTRSLLPRNLHSILAQSCLRRNSLLPTHAVNNLSRPLSTSAATLSSDSAPTVATGSANAISNSFDQLLFPNFPTIQGAERLIQHIHEITGLPWWSAIICTAFLLRMILMMPLTLYSFHNSARLQRLGPEVRKIEERLKVEVGMAIHQFGWNQKQAKEEYIKNRKRLLRDLYVRDNCHPMKNTVTLWMQMPLWISVSFALRNICLRAGYPNLDNHAGCSSLTEQGMAWFPDLTSQDTTWILPVMLGAVTLFNVEMSHLNLTEVTKYRKMLTYGLRSVALLFIPISASFPSAMVLYWVSSGMFASAQNLLFEYSPFRRLVGLPQSPTESNSPLQTLSEKAKAKYLKR